MTTPALPDGQGFAGVMERAIQLVGCNVPPANLRKVAEALQALRWDFPDYGISLHFLINDEGQVQCAHSWPGPVDGAVSMDAAFFHDAAFGRANFGAALLLGKLRIEGFSPWNLGRFASLLDPFLESYRQACTEWHDSNG
jgi:hypothetical protein